MLSRGRGQGEAAECNGTKVPCPGAPRLIRCPSGARRTLRRWRGSGVNRQHPRCERRAARKARLRARASGAGTIAALALWLLPAAARASMFHGETLDMIADYISWGVLVHRAGGRHRGVLAGAHPARRRSPSRSAIRRPRRSRSCACCRWCSAACCGRSRGCGPTASPCCTRWPTAPMSTIRMGRPGCRQEPDGTMPVLTTEAEVPRRCESSQAGA